MTGYTPGELHDMDWSALLHPDDHARATTTEADATGRPLRDLRLRVARKNGGFIALIWQTSPWIGGFRLAHARVVSG